MNNILSRLKLQDTYRAVFDTPDGKKVLEHLCKVGHIVSPTFVAGDPHTTSFREGERHIVLSILRFINRDTTSLLTHVEDGFTKE